MVGGSALAPGRRSHRVIRRASWLVASYCNVEFKPGVAARVVKDDVPAHRVVDGDLDAKVGGLCVESVNLIGVQRATVCDDRED